MRLQKYLSMCGIASRRAAEEMILRGEVEVNGKVSTIGDKVDPEKDTVKVKGKTVRTDNPRIYIAVNKPAGYICSCSSSQGRSILDLVKVKEKVFPIGRLDKESDGLVILTNDGEMANKLSHPKFESEKEYIVALKSSISELDLDRLRNGVKLLEGETKPCKIVRLGPKLLDITLKEGKRRQIRRMAESVKNYVVRLQRIRIKNIRLGTLKPGEWKYIDVKDH